jgi:hypothetical protein
MPKQHSAATNYPKPRTPIRTGLLLWFEAKPPKLNAFETTFRSRLWMQHYILF